MFASKTATLPVLKKLAAMGQRSCHVLGIPYTTAVSSGMLPKGVTFEAYCKRRVSSQLQEGKL